MDSQDHLTSPARGLTTCCPWSRHRGVRRTGRAGEGFKTNLNTTARCLSEEFKTWQKVNVAHRVGITDLSRNVFPVLLLSSHDVTLGIF